MYSSDACIVGIYKVNFIFSLKKVFVNATLVNFVSKFTSWIYTISHKRANECA